MNTSGKYGDQITLRAFLNLFNIDIFIFSTLENDDRFLILPENSVPIGTITLGHFAKGKVTIMFVYM